MSTPFSRDLYMRAWQFAAERHRGQSMSGSDLPYVVHLGAVAMEVLATIASEEVADPDLAVACALLHDTVEDTATTSGELETAFGGPKPPSSGRDLRRSPRTVSVGSRAEDMLAITAEDPPQRESAQAPPV